METTELQIGFGAISDAATEPAPATEVAEVEVADSPLLAAPEGDAVSLEDVEATEGEADAIDATEAAKPAEDGKPADKVVSLKTFKRRIGELAGQRETAKNDAREARAQLKTLEGEVGKLRELTKIVSERFRDDPQELEFVDSFMAEVEARAERDPNVKRFVQTIIQAIKGKGPTKTMTDTKTTTTPAAAAAEETPAPASKAEKLALSLINGRAFETATAALDAASVAPAHAKQIAAAFVRDTDAETLANAKPEDVIAYTRKYLRDNKIDAKEVLKSAPKGAKPKPKPSTAGATRGGAAESTAAPASSEEERPQYKSREEYDKARRGRLDGLLREMGHR